MGFVRHADALQCQAVALMVMGDERVGSRNDHGRLFHRATPHPERVPSQMGSVIPGCQTTHPAKALAIVILRVVRSEETAEAQSVGAGAQRDDDCDRRSLAVLEIAEGYISDNPVTTDPNTPESPPSSSSPALVSRKCKRSGYRKSTLKSLRMRCLISLIASSELKPGGARSPVSSLS